MSVSAPTQSQPIRPGMACRTPQGHIVRIDAINATNATNCGDYADVYVISAPHIYGPMHISELTPITTTVDVGDSVLLHAGDGYMPIRGYVQQVYGDYALFFLPRWNEPAWVHTAHVMSISHSAHTARGGR